MTYIIATLIAGAVGFVAGILVGRKNQKTVSTVVDTTKTVTKNAKNITKK